MSDTTLFEAFSACLTILFGLILLVCLRYCFMVLIELLFFDRYYNNPPWLLKLLCPKYIQNRYNRTNNSTTNNDIENQLRHQLENQEQDTINNNNMISLSELIVRVNHVFSDSNNNRNTSNSDKMITKGIIQQLLPGTLLTDDSIIDIQKIVNKSTSTSTSSSPTQTNTTVQTTVIEENKNDDILVVSTNNNDDKDDDDDIVVTTNACSGNEEIPNQPSDVVAYDNDTSWEDHDGDNNNTVHTNNTTGLPLCSICITDIKKNEYIFMSNTCHHIFHVDCIREWVVKEQKQYQNNNTTGSMNNNNHHQYYKTELHINNDCPNCRTPIIHNLKLKLNTIIRKYNNNTNIDGGNIMVAPTEQDHDPQLQQQQQQQQQQSSTMIGIPTPATTTTSTTTSTATSTTSVDIVAGNVTETSPVTTITNNNVDNSLSSLVATNVPATSAATTALTMTTTMNDDETTTTDSCKDST